MGKLSKHILLGIMGLLWFGIPMAATAGQVVTPEIQSWAKEAIAAEAQLAAPAATNTVAVLYFHNTTGDGNLDPLEKGLTLMLTTDLSKLDTIQVVERVRLQAIVQELDLGATKLVAPESAPRLGNLLGARWIVGGGDIARHQESALDIGCHLLDLPLDALLGRTEAQGPLTALFQLEKKLLHDIIELLNLALTPEQMKLLDEPMSTDYDALMMLFRGLTAADAGNYDQAAVYYEKSLTADPGLTAAKENLKELNALNLIRVGNTSGLEMLQSLRGRTSLLDDLISDPTIRRFFPPEAIQLPAPPGPPTRP